jgi:hypothetical protein
MEFDPEELALTLWRSDFEEISSLFVFNTVQVVLKGHLVRYFESMLISDLEYDF